MKSKLIYLGIVFLAIFGFFFLRGPTPHISIKPETLFAVGPVNFTNTLITSWITVAIIIVLVFLATRRWELVPSGVQNFFEMVVEAFYNLVVGVAGEREGRRFFPVVATIFFFILFANWLSLTPVFNAIGVAEEKVPVAEAPAHAAETEDLTLFPMEKVDLGPLPVGIIGLSSPSKLSADSIETKEPNALTDIQHQRESGKLVTEFLPVLRGANTDINTPLAIAVAAFIAVEFWGITSLGFGTYAGKFFNFGKLGRGLKRFNVMMIFEGAIDVFVGMLEGISELVRLLSFTFRLFGNMFAGEVVILMFTFLTPLLLTLPFYGLEIFVGVIQAFIFSMLTLVFGIMAIAHHGSGADEHAAEAVHVGEPEPIH
ncbi:MAG TPA: F0F1 ATP synthase subunit A [Dehalococcoidia bacterium]|nr:F0F1 ATP synthase subunit A [Dehalococcoidia bacterium]